MPKPLMDIATFNARYFAGRIRTGGDKYKALVWLLTKYKTTMTSGGEDYLEVGKNLQAIVAVCGDILTASKQPADSSKLMVVQELAAQAGNEAKYMGRRMDLGLAMTHDIHQVKQLHKEGVGKNYKSGTDRAVLKRLSYGDYKDANTTFDQNYWLEFCDPLHRPGFALHKYWVMWLHDKQDCYAMSFWDWLRAKEKDPVVLKEVNPVQKSVNKPDRPLRVRYLDATAREHYAKTPAGGQLFDSQNQVYDTDRERTHFSGPGWAIFVMDENYVLYAASHIVGMFHHSSFLSGQPTIAAGELICTNGKLCVITGKSGHYKPGKTEMLRLLRALVPENLMHANAVCKPSFDSPNWHKAIVYHNGDGNAPAASRADVVNMIPPAACLSQKVLDALPPV